MNEKLKFITSYLDKNYDSFTELCRRFKISTKTGYKYVNRYTAQGIDGLKEQSRAPHKHGRRMSSEIEDNILTMKNRYPHWGSKKLLTRLSDKHPNVPWPCRSTIEELLKRNNLVKPAKRYKRVIPYSKPFIPCDKPNDTWCIDYKGQFLLGNKEHCYPLTITDNFSRYILAIEGMDKISGAATKKILINLFKEFGMPSAIKSDNGSPFAANGLGGLSTLSVWLIKLGIIPERIRRGRPQENGRHERMHLTLKRETTKPAKENHFKQQKYFDSFKKMFNEERPHEGINFACPSKLYHFSERAYPDKLPKIEYNSNFTTRRIRTNGTMKWRSKEIFISESLIKETIGMKPYNQGEWLIYFSHLPIGVFSEKTLKVCKI